MRLIQVTVPDENREAVLDVVRDRGVEFAFTEEVSERAYAGLLSFPVEADEVEAVLDDLRAAGVERDGYVVVTETEAVVSELFDGDSETTTEAVTRLSREELRAEAASQTGVTSSYVAFSVLSAVVATAGLLTDSAAVVVGSMVIAPLLGPAIGASVGTVVGDDELFRVGLRAQAVGLAAAVASAIGFAELVSWTVLPGLDVRVLGQVAERANPGALSLVVALGSGAAGALSLTTGASAVLVGVMIAAALIPPAAAVGIGIAYRDAMLAASAGVLVLVNAVSINLASLGVLWARGYRPAGWSEAETARWLTRRRAATLLIGLLVLSSFLGVTTMNIRENTAFEHDVRDLARESDLVVLDVEIEYRPRFFARVPAAVTVYVADGTNASAARLERRIRGATDEPVRVTIVRERATGVGTDEPRGGTLAAVTGYSGSSTGSSSSISSDTTALRPPASPATSSSPSHSRVSSSNPLLASGSPSAPTSLPVRCLP